MGLKHYRIQLADSQTGENKTLADSGGVGVVYVAQVGLPNKQALFNKDGSTAVNPVVLVNGLLDFYVVDTAVSVDLYGQDAKGRGFILKGEVPSGHNEIYLDRGLETMLVIPYAIGDTAAATETDTGFNIPANAIVRPMGVSVDVKTNEASKTVSFGILSSESGGSATGFANAVTGANIATVAPGYTIASGVYSANTFGTLLSDFVAGTNADDRGLFATKPFIGNGTATSVSYTLSAGSAAQAGFLKIPMTLPSL